VIVADTGALYALYDADDRHHVAVRTAVASLTESIHVPTACLGELDYLLRERLGAAAELDFLTEVLYGRFVLESLTLSDVQRCMDLLKAFASLNLGLADAAVVATAERLKTRRVLTVDHRDFQTLRSADGKRFTILPEPSHSRAGRR